MPVATHSNSTFSCSMPFTGPGSWAHSGGTWTWKKMIRNQLNFPLRYFLKWTSVQFDGLLFFCHLSDPSISPSFLVWTGYIGCKSLLYYFFYNSNLIYTDIPHCSILYKTAKMSCTFVEQKRLLNRSCKLMHFSEALYTSNDIFHRYCNWLIPAKPQWRP